MKTIEDMTQVELMECGLFWSDSPPFDCSVWCDWDSWEHLPREEAEERVKPFLRVKNTGLEGVIDI